MNNKNLWNYIISCLFGMCIGVTSIGFYMVNTTNYCSSTIYKKNTREIIHLQDSMIKELSDVLWFEYNYDLPEFDGDYNEKISKLKKEINL